PADPVVAQPVPRTAATAVIVAASLNRPRIDYLEVTILNWQPLPNALLSVTRGSACRFTHR
ncbi:MAG TPA: hypothetical protein VF940_05995, partial [Streptosporangiaceae bacterium]